MRSLHQLNDNDHKSKYPPHLVFIVVILVSTGFSGKMRFVRPSTRTVAFGLPVLGSDQTHITLKPSQQMYIIDWVRVVRPEN